MKAIIALTVVVGLIWQGFSCPLNPNSLSTALNCTQNIACVETLTGEQRVLIQNCNTRWYYGSTSTSIKQLTASSHSLNEAFISNSQKAVSIKANSDYALINFNNSKLFFYPLGKKSFSYVLPYYCEIVDYESLIMESGNIKILIVCGEYIKVVEITVSNEVVLEQATSFNSTLTKMECLSSRSVCLVGTLGGEVFIFNPFDNKIEDKYQTEQKSSISLLQIKDSSIINQNQVYIVYSSGYIAEYLLFSNNSLVRQRTSLHFKGEQVFQVGTFSGSNYLIVTDQAGNASQIDLSTGILLDSINMKAYLANKSSVGMSLLLNNRTSYFLYNTVNKAIFYADITPDNTKNQIVLSCFNLFYYNNTLQGCKPCSSTCATCDPLTGSCLTCISQYFNSDGDCLSCFFDSRGLTDHFHQCFSSNQQQVMQKSQALVQFLSVLVSNFAVILNICGLLFLFLQLINNWNIISLYFFVPIQIPFFLENVLKMLFTNFNSSVLNTIGISLNWSISADNRASNEKFQVMNLTTDFLEMNGQNVVLFLYSVVLIVTIYKLINFVLAKVNISVFEQNTAISIIEQFVGCFTVALLPFYYLVTNPFVRDKTQLLNYSLQHFLVGLSLVVPFCFLIFDYQYKVIRSNKVSNGDENQIAASVNLGLTKRIRAWRQDDSKQRFLYALLSFSTALLACNPNPSIFIFGIGALNLFGVINSLAKKTIKINNLIQKLSFFSFHCCFSSLYFIQDGHIQFKISLVLVMLIIFIAVHELLLTLYKKIYFLYILIKGKLQKQAGIKAFFEKNQQKMLAKDRAHPIELPLHSKHQGIVTQQMKFTFDKFEMRVVTQTEKPFHPHSKKKIQVKKKKVIKTQKKVGHGSSKTKKICFPTKKNFGSDSEELGKSIKSDVQ